MAIKKGTIAAAVAAILVVGYPASAWFLGGQIEAIASKNNERITAVPYLKLVRYDYERSLFSADETLTIEIPAEMFAMPSRPAKTADASSAEPDGEDSQEAATTENTPVKPPPVPAPQPPIRVTIKSHIQHGPLINFSTFAAGRAETTVEFEGKLQQILSEAFSGKPVLSAQTLFNFQGGGQSTVSMPAFKKVIQASDEEGKQQVTISGDGMQIAMDFTKHLAHYTFQGNMPRVEMTLPNNASVKMLNLHMEGNMQRLFEDNPLFYSGTQQVSLAEFSFDPGSGNNSDQLTKVSVKDIKHDLQMPVSGDFIDMIMKTGVNVIQVGEQNYGPARYDISLKHLHTRKTVALYQDYMAIFAKPENLQAPEQLLQSMEPLKKQLFALLLDSPQISLDRLSFRTPEGEAELAASIKLDNAKAEDFANPMRLQQKIDFAANVALPVKLLTNLVRKKAVDELDEEEVKERIQKIEQTTNYLVQQGYASLENGLFKSKITLKAGQLQVNDKPFNPMAMMMQMQEPQGAEPEEEEETPAGQ